MRPGIKVGRWTEDEHELFLEALKQYGKDWNMI
jgi:SHAQKYF class myb-like DNA-binding protein